MSKTELPKFTIKHLLEAGAHFGHKSMRRNPKMARYIHGERNKVSIIDLNKTANLLHRSLKIVKEIAKNNGRILFIATKKQAMDAVEEAAKRCGQYYVNFRWLGGMLTNWKTVSRSIKTLKKIEEQLADTEVGYNKKEKLVLERKRLKLERALGGIKEMGGYPDLVFIIDVNKEAMAVAEAKKLNVPIMAILDTNCNPDGITFPIPANDDSTKTIKLFCRLISDAALEGVKESMAASGIDLSKLEGKEIKNISDLRGKEPEKKSEKAPHKKEEESDKPKAKHRAKKEIIVKSSEEKKSDEDKSEKKVVAKSAAKSSGKEESRSPAGKTSAGKKPATKKSDKK
jgi:small subunit ribosomal protein S2